MAPISRQRSARPKLLSELTWEEARSWQLLQPIVLLPLGATEAHGPHLPLGTDVFLSEELAARVALLLEDAGRTAIIAPPVPYAVTEFGAAFAGTVSISPETATFLLTDICLGLQRSGFFRVCLVNSHLEPAHVRTLRLCCDEVHRRSGHPVAFPDHTERRFARTLTEEYRRGNCHAGSYETSLLLSARPELVRQEILGKLARNDADFLGAMKRGVGGFAEAGGPRAYFGDPQSATEEEGEGSYHLLAQMALTVIGETWPA